MSVVLDRFLVGARGQWRERAAIVTESSTTTYAGLADKVDELARELRRHGFVPGDAAVTSVDAGGSVAVSMFAIWSLGGVYVPVSPSLPAAREQAVVDGVLPRVVLRGLRAADGSERVTVEPPANNAGAPAADGRVLGGLDAAYVIHTSGSTGRPKGVVVAHDNLATLAENHEAHVYSRFAPHASRVSLNNPPETDASLSELVQLGYGRTLYVMDPAVRRSPARMALFLERHRLEILDATPSQVRTLLLAGHARHLADLSLLMVGGEEIDEELWNELADLPVPVVNLYGPSECTVDVTFSEVSRDDPPNIGREFPGTLVRILGEDGRPVRDGEVGEICVSGAQVALGYLEAGAADTAGFVLDGRLGAGSAARSYRTGDRGQRLASGAIRFAGRADDQVKVRGHRVELGEVEQALRAHPSTRWACVAADETGLGSALRAFVILEDGADTDSISAYLALMLPPHALPTVHQVEEVPMAASGKVDRARLLERLRHRGKQLPLHPERFVREVWQRHVGGADVVTDQDDFFASGGNSIAAALLTIELRDSLAPGLAIDVLYRHPTFGAYLREVARIVAGAGRSTRHTQAPAAGR